MKIHICLVSSQPTPNITPVMDPELRPDKVFLLVSRDMAQQAIWLEETLKANGITVEYRRIENPWDIENVLCVVMELVDSIETEKNTILLNATGGTKPMSIAAYEACRAYDLKMFYVHPETDRVVWLHPSELPAKELADRIKLETFFKAHGVIIEGEAGRSIPEKSLLETGQEIINYYDKCKRAIGQINLLAASAKGTLRSRPVKWNPVLQELVRIFEIGGYLQRDGDILKFKDELSRFFVNGGWLEYLVFDTVRTLRKKDTHIHDIAYSINIVRMQSDKRIPNELDVAFLRNNRLHIIECKTRDFQSDDENKEGAQALYKLDTLADITGGLQARAMLVSYKDLPEHDRRRAADLKISVCAGSQIKQLKRDIHAFMEA